MKTQTLLQAIVAAGGEALVLHPGDAPYIATPGGRLLVSSRPLTIDRLRAFIAQLLPPVAQTMLEKSGAVQWEIPCSPNATDARFVVVAARIQRELWAEVRRVAVQPAGLGTRQASPRSLDDRLEVPNPDDLRNSDTTATLGHAERRGLTGQPVAARPSDSATRKGIGDLDLPKADELWPEGGRAAGRSAGLKSCATGM